MQTLVDSYAQSILDTVRDVNPFEIFAVKYQKSVSERPILVHPTPFLDPHLDTP